MGVKGLWKKVEADTVATLDNFVESIPRGSVLHVDAMGFVFHMYEAAASHRPASLVHREFGGDYSELRQVIQDEIKRLVNYFGLQLIFYFDGPTSFHKGNTTMERRRQIEQNWQKMFDLTLGDCEVEQHNLPLPPLSSAELAFTLASKRIQVVHSKYEADQDIALGCMKCIKKHKVSYCYAGDSDLLVMKGCPLIKFGAFDGIGSEIIPHATKPMAESVKVPVWSRSSLAAFYGLTPHQFVEWCVLIGNDFTRHFPTGHFGDDVFENCPRRTPDEVLDFIKSVPAEYTCLPGASEDLQAALAYSRAMYELENLQPYCLEQYKTINTLDESSELDNGVTLQKHQKERIEAWLSAHEAIDPKLLSTVVISYLESCLGSTETAFIKAQHVEALRKMVKQMPSKPKNRTQPLGKLSWDDIRAGNFYQLVVKEVHRFLRKTDPYLLIDPSILYDGSMFHQLVGGKKATKPLGKAAPSLVPAQVAAASVSPVKGTPKPKGEPKEPKKKNGKAVAPVASSLPIPPPLLPARQESNGAVPSVQHRPLTHPDALPADSYREDIVNKIRSDRVTIIHGETGCGKSSRIPVFLYEDALQRQQNVKIMISQPRRLAVVNLRNRLKEQLGTKVGMRMGHGVREESKDTVIHFVTSGYLVQLLAHQSKSFATVTHLIIDEVHERSVDSDLLCWLAKRLLVEYPHLRLVLMSATLHTRLYQEYFSALGLGDLSCLSVGARRFPVEVYYPDDLMAVNGNGSLNSLPSTTRGLCARLIDECNDDRSSRVASTKIVKDQYDLAVTLVRTQCEVGTGVLIFVSGLDDIIELQSRFENMPRYRVIAIHSHIPFEEQEAAMQPAGPGEVKVVVATNAAESSVTLPDVDVVICCGMHKEVNYKPKDMMRSVLVKGWISKSSATQRAGRTGRVRPGTVFRLYSKERYKAFPDFQTAEISRTPLHEVILKLQAVFEDAEEFAGVTPILQNLLEPPAIEMIVASLQFLFTEKMITEPNDFGVLTSMGSFAGRMPLDLLASKLVIYGIAMGIGAETVVLAAALNQPKTLFRLAHPLIHSDPEEYNAIVNQTFFGSLHFDGGTYSDPIMMLNIFLSWQSMDHAARVRMSFKHGLVMARVKHFISSALHLASRVKEVPSLGQDMVKLETIAELSSTTINRLRLVLLWVFHGNMMVSKNKIIKEDIGVLSMTGKPLSADSLTALFNPLPFKAELVGKRTFQMNVAPYSNFGEMEMCVLRSFLHGMDAKGRVLMSMPHPAHSNLQSTRQQQQQKGKKKDLTLRDAIVVCDVNVAGDGLIIVDPALNVLSQLIHPLKMDREFLNLRTTEDGPCTVAMIIRIHGIDNDDLKNILIAVETERAVVAYMEALYSTKIITMNLQPEMPLFTAILPNSTSKDFELLQLINARQQLTFAEDKVLQGKLFNDLPVGKRLFNAYCSGYKDKKMKVRESAQEGSAAAPEEARRAVVGSAEWRAQKERDSTEGVQEGPTSRRPNVPTVSVMAKNCSSGWIVVTNDPSQCVDDEDGQVLDMTTLPWTLAFITNRSIIAASNILPTAVGAKAAGLIGVAYSSTTIASERPIVSCEGVTLFPPGPVWISRALLCIGKKIEGNAEKAVELINGQEARPSKGGGKTMEAGPNLRRCQDIRYRLLTLKDRHLAPSADLMEVVDLLFQDFL